MTQPPTSLVLLHGFASTFDHGWRQTGWVDILGDFGCDVPEIDLPGHGSSRRDTAPEDYADVEDEVFGALPSPGPLNAVGFSAGADLLLRLALAHPSHFERIALLGLGDSVFETNDTSGFVGALESETEPENVQARLFHRLARSTGNDPKAISAFMLRERPPLREDQLATLTFPILVVLGERDTSGDRLVAALPSATLVTLPAVDHFATPSDFGAIDATMRFFGLE
jgi:pimeloyl-ACP methyl ester carboxylesterase